jgi:tetratricopeptide (TPR) repeat protein
VPLPEESEVRPSAGRDPARWLVALSLVAAVAIAYAGSLHVPFHLDDTVVITGEPAVTHFQLYSGSRRFLGDLSFAISYRLSGERTLGYHLVNVAIHVANALLVFALAASLLGTARAPRARAIAWLTALLFAVHPIQTQAVTYIVQRYASLACLFFLLATLAYVRFRLAAGARAAAWYALFLASAGAAFWTKENSLVLPLVLVLVEVAFFSAPLHRRVLFFAPFLLGGVWLAVAIGLTPERLDAMTRIDTEMSRQDYFLTQLRVVAAYLRLLVLPVGQNVDHDVEISRSLLEPAVLLAAALHLANLALATFAVVRGRRDRPLLAVAGFGVVWFYVTLLVESSFIPIVDVMFEHRVYLPSVGFFLAVAALLAMVPRLSGERAWVALALALALPLGALTIARNRVWSSHLALWTDAAEKSPRKPRALNNLGVALLEQGDLAAAASLFERTLRADPSSAKAWFNLGEARQRLGDCGAAMPAYERFVEFEPDYPDTYRHLAECWALRGRPDLAAQFQATYQSLAGSVLPLRLR